MSPVPYFLYVAVGAGCRRLLRNSQTDSSRETVVRMRRLRVGPDLTSVTPLASWYAELEAFGPPLTVAEHVG